MSHLDVSDRRTVANIHAHTQAALMHVRKCRFDDATACRSNKRKERKRQTGVQVKTFAKIKRRKEMIVFARHGTDKL